MLNFPVALIRTSTERPETLDSGSIVIGGINYKNIINAIELVRKFKTEAITLNKDYQS